MPWAHTYAPRRYGKSIGGITLFTPPPRAPRRSQSVAIHSFLMFMPFFVIKSTMVLPGIFLWLTGPFLAAYISENLFEQVRRFFCS